jgi:glutamate N-acetyltransferase / amino-acid N-acetyltransferase
MISTSAPMDSLCIPGGFKAAGIAAGIKRSGARDVALIVSEKKANCAAVFTTNQVAAAPVLLSRKALIGNDGFAQAILVSSGNANAATGEQGLQLAGDMCTLTAELVGCPPEHVLIGQTGLIGKQLDKETCLSGVRRVHSELSFTGWRNAASAIMTTDTVSKTACSTLVLDGALVSVLGIAKGVAMHSPNMATMIAVLVTDAAISSEVLQTLLSRATDRSFHGVNIDGCMSTNDSVFCLANGVAGNPVIDSTESKQYAEFAQAFTTVARSLATLHLEPSA